MFVVASAIIASKRSVVKRENLNRNVFQFDWLRVGLVSWITPALTEACENVQLVKIVVGYNGRSRPSDDWPTLTKWTLRFNALLSRQRGES